MFLYEKYKDPLAENRARLEELFINKIPQKILSVIATEAHVTANFNEIPYAGNIPIAGKGKSSARYIQ